jgi:hypothetical protein
MAFFEIERYRLEKPVRAYVEANRPAPHIRPDLDIGYRKVQDPEEWISLDDDQGLSHTESSVIVSRRTAIDCAA